MNSDTENRGWRPVGLLVFQGLALLLLASWWFKDSTTRLLWDQLDQLVFFSLNGSLAEGESWQRFWAIANNRAFDLVSAILVMLLYARFSLAEGGKYLAERIAAFILVFLFTLLMIEISNGTLEELSRKSPSLILEPVYRLTELVPDITAKDFSASSFPGDHASVLMLWTGYFWLLAGARYGLIVLLIAVLFSMPRVVAGAHWFTDDVVGSGFVALTGLGWLFYTPLCQRGIRWMLPVARKIAPIVAWIMRLIGIKLAYK